MTRKDYVLIAGAFKQDIDFCENAIEREIKNRSFKDSLKTIKTFARTMALTLQRENPRFNQEQFLTACGVKESEQ